MKSKMLNFLRPTLAKIIVFVGMLLVMAGAFFWYSGDSALMNGVILVLLILNILPVITVGLLCPETAETGKSTCGTFLDALPTFAGGVLLLIVVLFASYIQACLLVTIARMLQRRFAKTA